MLRPYNGGHRIRVRKHKLGNKQRVAQVWKRVVKALRGVDGAERSQIVILVFANEHFQ